MKKYVFTGVLKDEMNSFLKMRESQGFKDGHRYILLSLNKYLNLQNISEKALNAELVDSWLAYACSGKSSSTKNLYIGYYHSFAKFLRLVGTDVFIPDFVRVHNNYTPYIFTTQEIHRIFEVADDLRLRSYITPQAQFSMLLRLLYGCGLRLGEALALTKGDINLNNGTLFIRNAKGNQDRLVPVDPFLTETLSKYCDYFLHNKPDDAWVFESDTVRKKRSCVGKPRTPNWAQHRFRAVLAKSGIDLPELPYKQRNICLHCLRHTFIVRSFRKQDLAGIDSYDSAASISVYVGHYNLTGTQRYMHMTAENSKDIIDATNEYSKGMFPKVYNKSVNFFEKQRNPPMSPKVKTVQEYMPNAYSNGIFPEVPR